MTNFLLSLSLLVAATVLVAVGASSAAAAGGSAPLLGIDFGNEWIKLCLVSPTANTIGSHLDVVVNEQSNRKTPNLLGFDSQNDQIYSEQAVPLLFRSPARVFPQIKRLIGKNTNQATAYANDHPSLKLLESSYGHGIEFKKQEGNLSVDEIVSLLFNYAKRLAENHILTQNGDQSKITEVVVSIPENYTATQRKLMKQLLTLAGLNTRALVNELTAVAIDYAVRNIENGQSKKIAFFSIGTHSVSANVVQINKNDKEYQVNVLKSLYDDTLGGYTIDVILRDLLANKFDELHSKKLGTSIKTSPRALAKLLREARELKEQLSVSTSLQVLMEEVFEGKDFSTVVTKEELETAIASLLDRFSAPIVQVMEGMEGIDAIEIFGGGVRIPAIQAHLKTLFPNIAIGKHVDGDEAAVFGAAYLAGVLDNVKGMVPVTINDPANADEQVSALSDEQIATLTNKLHQLANAAEERKRADTARNDLESFVARARELIDTVKVKTAKAEKELLQQLISEASTFIDDSTPATPADEFTARHTAIQGAYDALSKMKPEAKKNKYYSDPSDAEAERLKQHRRRERQRAKDKAAKAKNDKAKAKAKATNNKAKPAAKANKPAANKGKGKKDEL